MPTNISSMVKTEEEKVTTNIGRKSAYIESVHHNIRTAEDLLKHAKFDAKEWDIVRVRINSYEGFIKDKFKKIRKVTLFQIRMDLEPKKIEILATEKLIQRIEKGAKFSTPSIRSKHLKHNRCLELAIMDMHFGLLCRYPEADAPQSLESAGQMMMTAMDDLIGRAMVHGPFEQAVFPLGNDFIHADNVFHTTTAGTVQPECIDWHHAFEYAEERAIEAVEKLRQCAKRVFIYEVPGNHSRQSDFALARIVRAYFHNDKNVVVDDSSRPYKFHHFGVNLIGYEHGHSVKPIRLAALMANECRDIWAKTEYREWHVGDQHRKGAMRPSVLEEQGVSIEYIPSLCAPNSWHTLKSFSHQKRGAMAFVWDHDAGQLARLQFNVSQYTHEPLQTKTK